jgi:hypothetical protein
MFRLHRTRSGRLKSALVAISVAISATPASAAVRAVANSFADGVLYDINLDTGAISNPRNTGLHNLAGIAYSPDNVLYGLTAVDGTPSTNSLYRINLATGASTLVGATGLTDIFEGDLFFSPSGVLYGLANGQGGGPNKPQMFTLNTATGQATAIGPLKPDGALRLRDPSAGTFTPDGRLFVIDDYNFELLEVDPATARITLGRPMNFVGITGGMVFDPGSGLLYAVDGTGYSGGLSTFDLSTGQYTEVQRFSPSLAGMTIIPEPVSVLTSAPLACCWVRRRR